MALNAVGKEAAAETAGASIGQRAAANVGPVPGIGDIAKQLIGGKSDEPESPSKGFASVAKAAENAPAIIAGQNPNHEATKHIGQDAAKESAGRAIGGGENITNITVNNSGGQSSPSPQAQESPARGFKSLASSADSYSSILAGSASNPQQEAAQAEQSDQAKEAIQAKIIDGMKKFSLGMGLIVGGSAALFKLPDMLDSFGKALISGQEHLKSFNGQIANSFAQLERQDLELKYRTGNATGGTTQALVEEQMRFNEEAQEIKEVMQNLWNIVGIVLIWIARIGVVVIKLTPIFIAIKKAIEWLAFWNDKKEPPWKGFLDDIADRKFDSRGNRSK